MLQKLGVRDGILQNSKVDRLTSIGDLIDNNEFPNPSVVHMDIKSMRLVFTQGAWDHISAKGKLVSSQILANGIRRNNEIAK